MKSLTRLILPFVAVVFTAVSCIPEPLPDDVPQTVDSVDLARYAGTWYEIASYPQIFELGCNCVTATYGALPNGNISVLNKCTLFFPGGPETNILGEAAPVTGSGNAKLNVGFFGGSPNNEGPGNYWIIGLDDDYQWALVSDPFRSTFWILSRSPQISDGLYDELMAMAEEQGIIRNRVRIMNQGCE
jgi:lipocalin